MERQVAHHNRHDQMLGVLGSPVHVAARRDKDFEHASICPRRGPGQRPYMELLEMLKAIQDDLPEDSTPKSGHRPSKPT
ncbi:hypothetical protein NHF39_17630 [Pseudomonas proteolytica]|nr:hypothetical protein [Pseudomonas proteolytica]USW93353.1 hypothetical protein NHF39_17630 [Pseudomonas proteolytica]USX02752.1 hypothetical protein NHF41_13775 [Pseudomonas proteolytica]